jgi:adenylate cyclase
VSYLDEGEEVLCHPSFGRFLLDHGYASFFTSTETEVVRRGRVGLQLQGSRALALATVILSRLRGWDVDRLRDPATRVLPDGTPLDQTVTIDYAGPPNAIYRERSALAGGFTVCPSHLVAAGVYPPGLFEDKVVLIGSGLADAPDRFRTPYFSAAYGYEKTFGVEIHAQFLSTLMSESGLPRASGWTVTAAVVVTAFGLLGAVLAGHAVWAGVACVVLSVAGWTAAYLLFAAEAVVVPVAWPTASIWIAYGLGLAFYGLTEGRQRRRTRGLFEKYVAPEVVSQLLEDPQTWELGGREVEITVMFADLEGFTPLAERMAAQELVEFMNGYLSEMTAIILEEDGTIDKYEGDLVMAFFGAPVPMDDHAVRACRAAVAMQSRMAALRQEWETQGLPAPRVRIGLHSGTAVVGNMGSELRFNYTAMGDTVNLAARLEQLNKEFGTLTMVSGETRRLVDGAGFELRALGATPVKGKAEPVEVFEVVT